MHPLRRRGQAKERSPVEGDLSRRVGAREDTHVLSKTKAKDGVRGVGCSSIRCWQKRQFLPHGANDASIHSSRAGDVSEDMISVKA